MTIFNLGYFQAKVLNRFQQEKQQQHIDCMDLAIKNHDVFNHDMLKAVMRFFQNVTDHVSKRQHYLKFTLHQIEIPNLRKVRNFYLI